jgi:hypothetical protein
MKKAQLTKFVREHKFVDETREEIKQELRDLIEKIKDWILAERYSTAQMITVDAALQRVEDADFNFEIDNFTVSLLDDQDNYVFNMPVKYLTNVWDNKMKDDFWENHMTYFNINPKDLR